MTEKSIVTAGALAKDVISQTAAELDKQLNGESGALLDPVRNQLEQVNKVVDKRTAELRKQLDPHNPNSDLHGAISGLRKLMDSSYAESVPVQLGRAIQSNASKDRDSGAIGSGCGEGGHGPAGRAPAQAGRKPGKGAPEASLSKRAVLEPSLSKRAVLDPFYVEVGRRIQEARRRQNLTQDQLASAVGLTRTSITNIEKGRQHISMRQGVAIASRLRVDIGSLAPPEEKPSPRAQLEDSKFQVLLRAVPELAISKGS